MKKDKKNKNKEVLKEEDKLGKTPFIIAWMSFIPVFGIFFALIAIMIILSTEKEGKKRLSVIAAIGFVYSIIVVTIFLYMELQRYTGIAG
jgi:heme/copper-type cytochrome/quinol oxidase subunit 4